MLSGEDALDEHGKVDRPFKGLPHERFLLGGMAPIAPVLLLGQASLAVNPSQEIACLQPVHLHATRDHLILMSQNQIDLTEVESSQLLKVALPFIEKDFQGPVLFQNHHYWFIQAGPFASLASYSVDQAHGRNIDWWMPRDTHEEGIAKRDAIRRAAATRLRPVLMTSAATVFGHVMLIFVTGPGAAARNSIGWVLVIGMAVGTIFTLYVVPAFYMLIARDQAKIRQLSVATAGSASFNH